jgi:hypothetical protein
MAGSRRRASQAAAAPVRWRLHDSSTGATGPTIVGALSDGGGGGPSLRLLDDAGAGDDDNAVDGSIVTFEFADPALLEWYGTRVLPQPRRRRRCNASARGGEGGGGGGGNSDDGAAAKPPASSGDAFDSLLGLMNEASQLHAAGARAHRLQPRTRWWWCGGGGALLRLHLLLNRVAALAARVTAAAQPSVLDAAVDHSLLLSQLACKYDDVRALAAALARLSRDDPASEPVSDTVAVHAAAWDAGGRLVLDAAAGVLLAHALAARARAFSAVAAAHAVNAHLSSAVAWLAGLPLGLKLNRPLAHKLAHAGAALTDVWDAALAAVPPLAPALPPAGLALAAVAALCGASAALGAASDLAALLTLHVGVAYRQTCWLHGRLRAVLASLWRLFRGRKTNVLRGRVDSHVAADAVQALLGTLLFTSLCFLLPTVAVFHALAAGAAACRGGVRLAARVALAVAASGSVFPLVVSLAGCCCRRYSAHCRPLWVRLESDAAADSEGTSSSGATRWRLVRVPASGVADAALVAARAAGAVLHDAALPATLVRALWGT